MNKSSVPKLETEPRWPYSHLPSARTWHGGGAERGKNVHAGLRWDSSLSICPDSHAVPSMKATALQFYLGMDLPWSSTITKSYFCVLVEVTKLLSCFIV